MPIQRFYASPSDTFTSPNGAVGHRPGGAFDCLGPYAKVTNCPVEGLPTRHTIYATGYADTWFSVPAAFTYRKRYVAGYFTSDETGVTFRVLDQYKSRLELSK
jgi:hypothetical protein